MKILSERVYLDSRWFSPERDVERTSGLHLSHVMNYIEQQEGRGYLKPDDSPVTNDIGPTGHAFAAAGFLWEDVVTRLIDGRYGQTEMFEWLFTSSLNKIEDPDIVRPGEQFVDGIYLTPDGFRKSDGKLLEYKYTTKSSSTPITDSNKFGRWTEMQIPAYLHALGLTECELNVYHAKGDYRNYEPVWMRHSLEYEQEEIDEIWAWIVRNARAMEEEGLI